MHSGPIQLATDNSGVESFWLLARRCGLRIPGVAGRPRRRQQDCTVRTPDVVEFAVSPQAGQASTACPTREALAIEFPAGLKLRADIRSSDRGDGSCAAAP
jgi:hypothetical protein